MALRILLLLASASSLFAQQTAEPPAATLRLDVRQVLVPVVVMDKKGHRLTGFAQSDFRVYEDGVSQDIVAFSRETTSPIASSAAVGATGVGPALSRGAESAAIAKPNIWVICFDTLHTSFASFTRATSALEKMFEKGQATGDRFVLISLGRQLRIVQTATADPAVLRAKLRSKEFANLFGGSGAAEFANEINDLRKRMDLYCTACACGRSMVNKKDVCQVERQQIREDLNARAERRTQIYESFFGGLKAVLDEFAKIDAHRTLILVSDGFTLMPGKELFAVV